MRLQRLGWILILVLVLYLAVFEFRLIDLSLPLRPDKGELSFALVREKVLAPRCLSCHAEMGEFVNIRNNAKGIQRQTLELRRMPPKFPLTRREATILTTWFEKGMPENAAP